VRLAVSGIITQSMLPLRLTGYLGVFIVFFSGVLGIVEFIDRFVYSWGFNFSGPAILATIILFLVGIVLMSIGLLAFYIEHIYRDSQSRPLYVVREIR
jgi:dolichol-phosphate mannosyltransferase